MLAGSRAKKDGNPKIGYMATFPIPEELRLGNAITRGVKVTCPECTVDVRFIQTWHDPQQERQRGGFAVRRRCRRGVHRRGHGRRRRRRGGQGQVGGYVRPPASCKNDSCLTAPYWIWGPEYTRIAKQVQAKQYKAGYEYFDGDSKAMGLYGFMEGQTPQKGIADLPAADVQKVKDTLAKILAGQFGRFDVFAGPIKDNTGKELLAAGQKLKQSDLDQFPPGAPGNACSVCMYWWADGITAPLPKLQ
jgi:basic membrane protein A